MSVVEKLITEQNQYDLFYNILLSVKSKNPKVTINEEDRSNGKCKLSSSEIPIIKTDDVKTELSNFYLQIERTEEHRVFSKNFYKYSITIDGNTRGYTSFRKINFKYNLSNRCNKVIGDIFDYLYDIEEQRKINETNNTIKDIINDISTTVDKAYKRDNKIDEVLNNN